MRERFKICLRRLLIYPRARNPSPSSAGGQFVTQKIAVMKQPCNKLTEFPLQKNRLFSTTTRPQGCQFTFHINGFPTVWVTFHILLWPSHLVISGNMVP